MKKIVFWGAGQIGMSAIDHIDKDKMSIDCFIDNDPSKWGTEYKGIKIYPPAFLNEIGKNVEIYVTVNNTLESQVISQLSDLGFIYGEDVFTLADKYINERFVNVRPCNKGSGGYKKYYAEAGGSRFFVIAGGMGSIIRFEMQFLMMKEAARLGVPLPHPIEHGTFGPGVEYLLLEYLDGVDPSEIIPALPEKKQYELGLSAGEFLRKIHSVPLPANYKDWLYCPYNNMTETIKLFYKKGSRFTNVESTLLKYVEQNKDLMKKNKTAFVHGDYGLPNMMLVGDELKIVDFNNLSFGAPLWDLYPTVLPTVFHIPCFASGQLHGYFGGDPTVEDWRLLLFYASIAAITFIQNATLKTPYNPDDLKYCRNICAKTLEHFNDMQAIVPNWYIDTTNRKDTT